MIILAELVAIVVLIGLVSVRPKAEEPKKVEPVFIYIWEVAQEFDINPFVLASLVYQESRFIVEDNLTQITNPKWFYEGLEYCGSHDITNPYVNIKCCGYYLNKWQKEKGIDFAVMAWNIGYENAKKRKKLNRYAVEILSRAEEWESDWKGVIDERTNEKTSN